jgi:lytic murein transglycosylase
MIVNISWIGLARSSCTALLLSSFAAAPILIGLGEAAAESTAAEPAGSQADLERFHAFLEGLFPLAAARGIDRATFDLAFRDLTPDPAVASAPTKQSEFERPFSAYFEQAVAARRIAEGRALAKQWARQLDAIATETGVPGPILLAAWGMESDFGQSMGSKDVIRSLATLAFRQPERPLFRDELLAALVILAKHSVPRNRMTGSWAGAMGGPQFLPSAYLKDGVSFSGSGAPDIWTNVPDILASIATFLQASGWARGTVWGMEVRPPSSFDYSTLHGDFRRWAGLGFIRADGARLPAQGAATLFFPEGAKGPAFLLADNYWVIKTYNNSDAYALSFACLADAIAGGSGMHQPWPKGVKLWPRSEKAEMQQLLQKLGFYKGIIDGRFGPTSRDAIHAFQLSVGDQPADGIGGPDLLARLRKAAQ